MDNLLLGMVAKHLEVYVRFCKITKIGEQVRENLLHLLKILDFIYMYRLPTSLEASSAVSQRPVSLLAVLYRRTVGERVYSQPMPPPPSLFLSSSGLDFVFIFEVLLVCIILP